MTRSQLAYKVAMDSQSGLGASQAWTKVVLASLADAIEHEDVVSIQGLGVFSHVDRKPKVGRNYKTGERVEIPAHTIIQFVPCEKIKSSVKFEKTQK